MVVGAQVVEVVDVFKVLQGPNPAALVEQKVDIPFPGGAFHDPHPDPGLAASSAVSRDEAFQECFPTFPRSQKSAQSAGSPSPKVTGSSSSWTPAAHHGGAVVRDDLWVQIMTGNGPYFWHRREWRAVWRMPPGTRPGWMRMSDGLFVHIETQNVLRSISGMHRSVHWWGRQGVDSVRAGVLLVPFCG